MLFRTAVRASDSDANLAAMLIKKNRYGSGHACFVTLL
jgi:hypothetical protein